MGFVEDGWEPDFPRVMHFVDLGNLYGMPWKIIQKEFSVDYDAAKKHEDKAAAWRIVDKVLNRPENRAQINLLYQKYPNAIIVPVRAFEKDGRNRLPTELAKCLALKTGLELDRTIYQANKVYHTSSDQWCRIAFRAVFEGAVKQNGQYILVDDVCTSGGTFSELRSHIERNGGKVLQTASLSLGGHGDYISMKPETRKLLLDKYSEKKLKSFLAEVKIYEGNYKCLTNSESSLIARAASLDIARDCIFDARRVGGCTRIRDDEKSISRKKTSFLRK